MKQGTYVSWNIFPEIHWLCYAKKCCATSDIVVLFFTNSNGKITTNSVRYITHNVHWAANMLQAIYLWNMFNAICFVGVRPALGKKHGECEKGDNSWNGYKNTEETIDGHIQWIWYGKCAALRTAYDFALSWAGSENTEWFLFPRRVTLFWMTGDGIVACTHCCHLYSRQSGASRLCRHVCYL